MCGGSGRVLFAVNRKISEMYHEVSVVVEKVMVNVVC